MKDKAMKAHTSNTSIQGQTPDGARSPSSVEMRDGRKQSPGHNSNSDCCEPSCCAPARPAVRRPSAQSHSAAGKIKRAFSALALAVLAFGWSARADDDNRERHRTPELPSPICDSVNVPDGHRLASRLYA